MLVYKESTICQSNWIPSNEIYPKLISCESQVFSPRESDQSWVKSFMLKNKRHNNIRFIPRGIYKEFCWLKVNNFCCTEISWHVFEANICFQNIWHVSVMLKCMCAINHYNNVNNVPLIVHVSRSLPCPQVWFIVQYIGPK